jgi:DNA repair protein SbcC/Rad50
MKISEFSILRYGPVRDTGRIIVSDFSLIFGDNENGKTLTIDALVKLLLGKIANERDFNALERIGELPAGYVILKDDDERYYKLPEHGTLPAIFGISAADCSNIFIIRNSNLAIENQHEYYTYVTDRLTGIQSRYIQNVIDSLKSLGRLTPTGMYVNTGAERLKSRIEDAISLADEVKQFRHECESENIHKLEQTIVDMKSRLKSLSVRIDTLHEARMREKYEKDVEALEKIVAAQNSIAEMSAITEEHLQRWRDHARDITRLEGEREAADRSLTESKNDLDVATRVVREEEIEWKHAEDRKRMLDETIRPLIKQYEQFVSTVPSVETRKSFFGIVVIITGILFGISLIGFMLTSGTFFSLIASLLFVLLIVSGILYFVSVRALSDVSADFAKLLNAVSRYSWDADNLYGILKKIELFEDEHRRLSERLQESRRRMQNLRERVHNHSENILPEIGRTLQKMEEEIHTICGLSGVDTIDDYRLKWKDKTELNKIIQTQSVLLKRDFGDQGDSLGKNISYWQGKIRELERYKDGAAAMGFDESDFNKSKDEYKKMRKELEDLFVRWSTIAGRMSDIEKKTNKIIQTDNDYTFCRTLTDLTVISKMLDEFITSNENTRDDTLIAIDIFTSILRDEQEKVSALFGVDKPVSKYFSLFTGGRYIGIIYDQNNTNIEVVQRNGNRLAADKLSGGAHDQLYFAIRLALGEELLKDRKGFFILDDPFIKSDVHRLREQVQMLRYIAGQGWQILLFSAKTEILDELKGDITDNKVRLIEYRRIE